MIFNLFFFLKLQLLVTSDHMGPREIKDLIVPEKKPSTVATGK